MSASEKMGKLSAEKTMELLWTRVRQLGDLPGFSKVASVIIGSMRGDDEREFNITRTVLQDPALTQKVLRLANSTMYSVFGQRINTVSKAVLLLGTEAIGHLALGLKLVDDLSDTSSASIQARAEMEKAVLAGHIARQVVSTASTRDAEEAAVCSMLHPLGRMLVTFYLAEWWPPIQARSAETGVNENQVAREILGISLDEIGRRAAQQWGLPENLVETLRDVQPNPVGEPLEHRDWLAAVSTLSSRCADVLGTNDAEANEKLSTLAGDYADMLGFEPEQVIKAVEVAQRTAVEEDAALRRPTKRAGRTMDKPADAAAILARGVADIRGVVDSASTGQLMSMALEIIYQGLGFSRAVAFRHKPERSEFEAQMCFGEGVQELVPLLVFSDAYQPDVFHAALANDKMIFIENAFDPAFANKLPRWWKDVLPTARSFMVLPLTVNRIPLGFLYGDWDQSRPPARIEQAEVGPLNELRTLITRTLEQRRLAEASWARKQS